MMRFRQTSSVAVPGYLPRVVVDLALQSADLQTDLRRLRQETQWRAALHVFPRRNIFTVSLLYINCHAEPAPGGMQHGITGKYRIID